jgi:hypothetical protein
VLGLLILTKEKTLQPVGGEFRKSERRQSTRQIDHITPMLISRSRRRKTEIPGLLEYRIPLDKPHIHLILESLPEYRVNHFPQNLIMPSIGGILTAISISQLQWS